MKLFCHVFFEHFFEHFFWCAVQKSAVIFLRGVWGVCVIIVFPIIAAACFCQKMTKREVDTRPFLLYLLSFYDIAVCCYCYFRSSKNNFLSLCPIERLFPFDVFVTNKNLCNSIFIKEFHQFGNPALKLSSFARHVV